MTRHGNPHVRRFLVASSLAFGLGSGALAQSEDRPGPMPSHGMGMHRMLRHLDLSDAQRDQVFKIFHDQSPEMRERMKAVRAARGDLEKLALASAFDRERARAPAGNTRPPPPRRRLWRRSARAAPAPRNRLTALEDIAQSAKALYAGLTPEQQKMADPRLANLIAMPLAARSPLSAN